MPNSTKFPPDAKKVEQPWIPDIKEELDPYAKAADVMAKAADIAGYDATKVQVLRNDSGSLKWVDVPEE